MRTSWLCGTCVMAALALGACSSGDSPRPDRSRDLAADHKTPDLPVGDIQTADRTTDRNRTDRDLVDADPRPLLTNENPCKGSTGQVVPNKGEEGLLAAARLSPSAYPFTVSSVRYELSAEADRCSNSLAHKVVVFVATTVVPPGTPAGVQTINAPAVSGSPAARTVEHTLATPITLSSGQHLFVGVSLPGDAGTATLCIQACDGNGIDDRNYWSTSPDPDYKWVELSSFGINANLRIEALGK
jgi:hypothetical protein